MTYAYDVSGVLLESDIPLSCLAGRETRMPAERGASVHIRIEDGEPPEPPLEAWRTVRTFDEHSPWLSIAKSATGYVLRFHGWADAWVAMDGRTIRSGERAGLAPELVEHVLVDHVLPCALDRRGRPTLHASAVALEGVGIVAFAGPSGAGKSTLALAMGSDLVADDCVAFAVEREQVVAYASYPAVRLLPDSTAALAAPSACTVTDATKVRVARPPATRSGALRAVYAIEPTSDTTPVIEELSRRDAIVQLAHYIHRLDPSDREHLARELDLLDAVAARVAVRRLKAPRDLASIDRLAAMVKSQVAPRP